MFYDGTEYTVTNGRFDEEVGFLEVHKRVLVVQWNRGPSRREESYRTVRVAALPAMYLHHAIR